MVVPKRLIKSLVIHFCRLAGFTGDVQVTFDPEEFERISRRRRYTGGPVASSKHWGATLPAPRPVIWINPKHKSWAALVDTCAHEALHVVAGPEHPDNFYPRLKKLLRNQEP